jgi:hypothetical protein
MNPLDPQQVQALAMAAGFGCVVDVEALKPGDTRAATYASKYVSKSTDQRGEVPWETLDTKTGELEVVADARYRTWSASQDWGLTMKVIDEAIRDAARVRAAAAAVRESPTPATGFAVSPACRSVPLGESWMAGTVSAVP